MLLVVAGTHQGLYSGTYRASRPDVAPQAHRVSISIDGFMQVIEGIPTQVDAANAVRLAGLFHGEPGERCAGILDMRPVPSLLQAVSSPLFGRYWGPSLMNLLAASMAAVCALDLARLWGRPPLVGVTFATLAVGGRGMAFYVGCPDAHALSLAWMPIGVWACERFRVVERDATPLGSIAVAAVLGLASLTHLANLALVAWLWLRGLGARAPWLRLLAITLAVGLILFGWRAIGAAAGLPFSTFTDRSIPDGLRGMWAEVTGRVYDAFHPPPGGMGSAANTVVQSIRRLPPWGIIEPLRLSLVPAFGWGLMLLAGTGWLTVAQRRDRLLALSLLVPSCVVAMPILYYWTAPRLLCLGWLGLAWPAALLLVTLERGCRDGLVRVGVGATHARAAGRGLYLALLGGLLLLENRDALGDMTVPVSLIWG